VAGAIGEVAIKGISGGNQMGSGPGGSVIADIEIRYALRRGEAAFILIPSFRIRRIIPPRPSASRVSA